MHICVHACVCTHVCMHICTYKSSLICYPTVTAYKSISSYSLTKHFYSQHIRDDILGLAVDIGVHQRNVVVAHNAVAQRRKPLLDSLDHHIVW